MEFDPIQATDDAACLAHICDPHLLDKVAEFAEDGECAICFVDNLTPTGQVVNLEHLARVVREYARRSFDHEGFYTGGEQLARPLDTETVVATLLARSVDLDALDLTSALVAGLIHEEQDWFEPWDSTAHLEFEWNDFEDTVKHVSRLILPYSGERATSPPEHTYAFVSSLLVFAEERAGLVHELPSGTLLYRARIERDARELERAARADPSGVLGPAPREKATAGRMNAQGVPLLYVALDPETACAEVASHSPYDVAVVGAFELQQPLRILDLSMVPPPQSVFDDSHREGDERLGFFSDYVERITRPVILDGNHPIDYAPTQVITEFLRWATDPRLDGIVYPSRVSDNEEGSNAVLFFGDSMWFTHPGAAFGSMASHLRWEERGSDEPLFVIDPQTIRRYRVERAMTVTRTHF